MIFLIIATLLGLGLSLQNSFFLNSKTLQFFRVLFPSWRFFEGLTPIPKIQFRLHTPSNSWRDLPISSINHRKWYQLFINPTDNLNITYQIQIEQFLNDLSLLKDNETYEDLSSYKITLAFLKQEIFKLYPDEKNILFDFKIGVLEFSNTNKISQNKIHPKFTLAVISENNNLDMEI